MNRSMVLFGMGLVFGAVGTMFVTGTSGTPDPLDGQAARPSTSVPAGAPLNVAPNAGAAAASEECGPPEITASRTAPDMRTAEPETEPTEEQIALFDSLERQLRDTAHNPEYPLSALVSEGERLTPIQRQALREQALEMIRRGELTEAQFFTDSTTAPESVALPAMPEIPTTEQLEIYRSVQSRIDEATRNKSASLADLMDISSRLTAEQQKELRAMAVEKVARGELNEAQFSAPASR